MNDISLLAKIRNKSEELNVSSHLLLQNYLLERLLFRISLSDYKENIILKGGLLIASLIGVDRRTTMDMDTAIKSYPVNEKQIVAMLLEILSIEANDGVSFEFLDIKVIRQKDEYNGYRARIISKLGKISQNLSIDISTGDVITPGQIAYAYKTLIDENIINIKSYNIESVLAEKVETIISRGVLNTRMRDFYDVYMLTNVKAEEINLELLTNAVDRTFQNRKSSDLLEFWRDILVQLEKSQIMQNLWRKYLIKNPYIKVISYEEIMFEIKEILVKILK